jgi:hypothetical protein
MCDGGFWVEQSRSMAFTLTCREGAWQGRVACVAIAGPGQLRAAAWDSMSAADWTAFESRAPSHVWSFFTPIHQEATPGPCLSSGYTDHFGSALRGFLAAPATGLYDFFLRADTAAELFIDGVSVVSASGQVLFDTSGSISLDTGVHVFALNFFKSEGSCALSLEWQYGRNAREVVPASAFFAGPDDADPCLFHTCGSQGDAAATCVPGAGAMAMLYSCSCSRGYADLHAVCECE